MRSFVVEELGAGIGGGLDGYVFAIQGTYAVRKIPQSPKVVGDRLPVGACGNLKEF